MICKCPKCKYQFNQFKCNTQRSIIDLLKIKNYSPTEIKKLLDIKSFGSVAYNLKILEKKGLIKKTKHKQLQGQPTYYNLIKL